jgi:hypothetical protein
MLKKIPLFTYYLACNWTLFVLRYLSIKSRNVYGKYFLGIISTFQSYFYNTIFFISLVLPHGKDKQELILQKM